MMLFSSIVLVVSLLTCQSGLHVSGCDYNCTDKPVFTPSSLVVKYGDPTSATCVACNNSCQDTVSGLEKSQGVVTENGTTLVWTVDRITEWDSALTCYYSTADKQCCTDLDVTVYQPPEHVSISFVHHTGPMVEGHQYQLQCTVENVAPAKHLVVTFYRGEIVLDKLQSKSSEPYKPVTETFTLNITVSKEDNGAQFWCEAKLELGPEGPQPPPVVKSENITATVNYGPKILVSANENIQITEGDTLSLNCSSEGNPSPSYSWKLPGGRASSSSDSVFIIQSVGSDQGGNYVCTVSNKVGTDTVNFSVDVQDGPKLLVSANENVQGMTQGRL
ncbi:vascular cell adhesion protein 1-like isoform X2 [Mugil cephalus]|uniref:vascular cell adhesion protein 1-like isoform X2 n=1 Tax=Mugil cephalus TaxID=48193 RepID=UPI001FB5B6E7|nr:vascular cell adhesion protein 1-like isoform X2 [Mugil cephalus]